MGTTTKSLLAFVMIVAGLIAAVDWLVGDVSQVGVGGAIVFAVSLGLILKLRFRVDLEQDYLRDLTGSYFTCKGLCFGFIVNVIDGVAAIDACFQSQRTKPCVVLITLRPGRRLLGGRSKMDAITYKIECPPAGFGFARVPVAIPVKMQGKQHTFEVSATVRYPDGKGCRVRFRDGLFLRSERISKDAFNTTSTTGPVAGGPFRLSSGGEVTIHLPAGGLLTLPDGVAPTTTVLWQLEQPPLDPLWSEFAEFGQYEGALPNSSSPSDGAALHA